MSARKQEANALQTKTETKPILEIKEGANLMFALVTTIVCSENKRFIICSNCFARVGYIQFNRC